MEYRTFEERFKRVWELARISFPNEGLLWERTNPGRVSIRDASSGQAFSAGDCSAYINLDQNSVYCFSAKYAQRTKDLARALSREVSLGSFIWREGNIK